MTTKTFQPTVMLTIQSGDTESHIAFNDSGELIETVDHVNADGMRVPDWDAGGVCDTRGAGGDEGYAALHTALAMGERNARLAGYTVCRLPA